jgi:hypothetical protein
VSNVFGRTRQAPHEEDALSPLRDVHLRPSATERRTWLIGEGERATLDADWTQAREAAAAEDARHFEGRPRVSTERQARWLWLVLTVIAVLLLLCWLLR